MFRIKQCQCEKTKHNAIEISNSETNTFAKINLRQGARLQELIIGSHHIINEMKDLEYSSTYASSILFPFANRIKDGSYAFQNNNYQFPINETELNNALHGLVFNKEFEVLHRETKVDYASIVLFYKETKHSVGFPYTFNIQLTYRLTESVLTLTADITNTDSKIFPFTVGWHPYFKSSDRYNSSVIFDSNKKLKLDDRCITAGEEIDENFGLVTVKNQELDDCYILKSNLIKFKTPKYILELISSEKKSFLQLYTPPNPYMLAIEPTTGVSDSFNNGMGLKTLKPQETYQIEWFLNIKNN
ncbi:aldose 1-epimerase [Winogradskyella sp. PE311]|uniref:aldose 1-epimerase n=1 Tax=Winogradskyella sp. PE311 TaxID=3366943 RepID=UPI003980F374